MANLLLLIVIHHVIAMFDLFHPITEFNRHQIDYTDCCNQAILLACAVYVNHACLVHIQYNV